MSEVETYGIREEISGRFVAKGSRYWKYSGFERFDCPKTRLRFIRGQQGYQK